MAFKNALSWFEIPAADLDRATKFYETIFGITLQAIDFPNISMRMFPLEDTAGVGGAIVDSGGFHKPSATDGPLLYLNANPDVQRVLDKGGSSRRPDHGTQNTYLERVWVHGGDHRQRRQPHRFSFSARKLIER
jgi:predicted enzyme related to lactoylglutathione lyase